ncbi:hypothetical protein PoB_004972500 [Plakobranchus ocellatus]|uniref:Uncharacterized protein n=1 Tax=Plakobranchus ocellatus TaxID=259542 RepID=A0AAV4BVS5_9GAST|nr:hypothetical protein PoB_004972500 [Plakobranchus ocellatus]
MSKILPPNELVLNDRDFLPSTVADQSMQEKGSSILALSPTIQATASTTCKVTAVSTAQNTSSSTNHLRSHCIIFSFYHPNRNTNHLQSHHVIFPHYHNTNHLQNHRIIFSLTTHITSPITCKITTSSFPLPPISHLQSAAKSPHHLLPLLPKP